MRTSILTLLALLALLGRVCWPAGAAGQAGAHANPGAIDWQAEGGSGSRALKPRSVGGRARGRQCRGRRRTRGGSRWYGTGQMRAEHLQSKPPGTVAVDIGFHCARGP